MQLQWAADAIQETCHGSELGNQSRNFMEPWSNVISERHLSGLCSVLTNHKCQRITGAGNGVQGINVFLSL